MARYRPVVGLKTKPNPRRAQRQPWETLVGWGTPDTFDDFLGIEIWAKKRRPNTKPKATGRRAVPRQPWEDYTCELGRYCDVIPDHDVYRADSQPGLRQRVKVTLRSEQAEGQGGQEVKDGAQEKVKEAEVTSVNAVSDVTAKGASQSKQGADPKEVAAEGEGQIPEGQSKENESSNTGSTDTSKDITTKGTTPRTMSHEPKSIGQGNASSSGFSNSKVLDMSINHLYLDSVLYKDLASGFIPRDQIVREAAAGLVKLPLPTARAETVPKPAPPKPQPVRLCYTQSNIRLPRPDLTEDESLEEDPEDEPSRLTLPLDDLVSDGGSWSEASDLEDYPVSLVPNRHDLEGDLENDLEDDLEDDLDDTDLTGGQWPQLNLRSHSPVSACSQKDNLLTSRANTPSDVTARLSSAGGSKAYTRRRVTSSRLTSLEVDSEERKPVSLVLKTMVLDTLPSVQPTSDTFMGSRTKSAKSRSKSSKSRSKSARSGFTNSEGKDLSTTTQFVTRSVDGRLGVTLPIEPLDLLQGVGQYSNPYKERLASRGLPIGDLLPAVDTSLKTNLAARKTPKRYEDTAWQGRNGLSRDMLLSRDMSVTGRETLLPYEDSLILMREGVEMLKMRENSTLLGPSGFRAVSTRTPLHRAQENVHKRLYGQLGLTRDLTHISPPDDQENVVLPPSLPSHGRWSSSNAALYSAPPRLGYVPKIGETPPAATRGSPSSSPRSRSPPAAPPVAGGSNTLSSLYKLSRRRKTRTRSRETETRRAAPKLKPPVTKSRPPPAGAHFRELAQLRT